MQLLTHSRLRSYRACPRQHRYAYTLGYRAVREAHALVFGTAAHTCLQAYWEARRDGHHDPADAAFRAISLTDEFDRVRLEAMLVAYTSRWDNEQVEVLEVERQFELPLINPETGYASLTFRMAGKIDLLLRLADGRVAIVDHKTTSRDPSAGSEYRDELAMDGQITQYFLGAESLGYAPEVAIWDVLVKPGIKPLLATPAESRKYTKAGKLYANQRDRDETLDEYRERLFAEVSADPAKFIQVFEVPRLDCERAEYDGDVWDMAAEIRASERTGRARRNPDSCRRYGTPCAYLPVCQKRASIEDTTLYQLTGPNPELSSPKEVSAT